MVFDELVSDTGEVERRLHERFAGFRVHPSREFFRIPVREGVRALQEESRSFRVDYGTLTKRIEILSEMRELHGHYLKPEIVGVAIVQLPDVCLSK